MRRRSSITNLSQGDEVGVIYYNDLWYCKFVEYNNPNSIIVTHNGRRLATRLGVVFKPSQEIKSLQRKVESLESNMRGYKFMPQMLYKLDMDLRHAKNLLDYKVRESIYTL